MTWTLVSRVEQAEDMALCSPFRARHSLSSPTPYQPAMPLPPLLDLEPSCQAQSFPSPFLPSHTGPSPQGGAVLTSRGEKERTEPALFEC